MLLELAPLLVKLGAPVLGSILRNEVGGAVGEAGAQVLDGLAGANGSWHARTRASIGSRGPGGLP